MGQQKRNCNGAAAIGMTDIVKERRDFVSSYMNDTSTFLFADDAEQRDSGSDTVYGTHSETVGAVDMATCRTIV